MARKQKAAVSETPPWGERLQEESPSTAGRYRIIELRSENIKRLTSVEIRPDGSLVNIVGPNGQGKTSVLDTIKYTLGGGREIQWSPIREGCEQARGQLSIGDEQIEYVITRYFERADGKRPPYTTRLEIRTPGGRSITSPQEFLNAMVGPSAFEPLVFVDDMDAKAQLEFLKQFVPFDFAAADERIKTLEEERVAVGRLQREQEGAASAIRLPPGMTDEPEDVAALTTEMARLSAQNADVQDRRARRQAASEDVIRKENEAERLRAQANDMLKQADALEAEAAVLERRLKAAPKLPEQVDLAPLKARIDAAARSIEAAGLLKRRREHESKAAQYKSEWAALTVERDKIVDAKRRAIAEAELPVPGLGFGDDHVTYRGLPLDQASHAEQLRVSIALAMAANPTLRVMRVTDGSRLDATSMQVLAEMAAGNNYQIWIERVSEPGEGLGFEISDGQLAGHRK